MIKLYNLKKGIFKFFVVLIALWAVTFSPLMFIIYRPVQFTDAILFLMGILAVPTLLLTVTIIWKLNKRLPRRILVCLSTSAPMFVIFFIIAQVFGINYLFDCSQGEKFTVLIEGTTISRCDSGRSISQSHKCIKFKNLTRPHLPFTIFKTSVIKIRRQDYQKVKAGKSYVTITLHPGFLSFPWISDDYVLTP